MKRTVAFDPHGWEDHVYWQTQDRKTLKRINQLITDVLRDPFTGIGKPEPLKHILSGAWSRRIDDVNRLVYYVTDEHIVILQVREHYWGPKVHASRKATGLLRNDSGVPAALPCPTAARAGPVCAWDGWWRQPEE
ncbi:hypothetical protein B5P43_23325 [Bacillus sp. SRB_336]|nr:hypothetical protein B5P43_23325 [Bacillus sp. SRB_336]